MTRSTHHARTLAALATLALALPGAAHGADLDGSGYYPNHKPIRGDYPGTYTRTTAAPPAQPDDGFEWRAAGAGAAAMLGGVLLSTALRVARLRAKGRSHPAPVAPQLPDH
jgi:hypothetical protein